jgi:hypothetical protein
MLIAGPAAAGALYGRYSDVCFGPETGDLGGMELVLRADAGGPSIVFKTCGGDCSAPPIHDLTLEGNRIGFVVDEPMLDDRGQVVEMRPHRFAGIFRRGALELGSPGYWDVETLPQEPSAPGGAPTPPSDRPAPVRICE